MLAVRADAVTLDRCQDNSDATFGESPISGFCPVMSDFLAKGDKQGTCINSQLFQGYTKRQEIAASVKICRTRWSVSSVPRIRGGLLPAQHDMLIDLDHGTRRRPVCFNLTSGDARL